MEVKNVRQIVLDIESKPNPELVEIFNEGIKAPANIKDPVKIEAAIEKKKQASRKAMSVSPHFCEIVCIGVMELGRPETAAVPTLKEFGAFLDKILNRPKDHDRLTIHDPIELIGYNSKSFDIPALINSFARHPDFISSSSFHALRDCLKFKTEFNQIKHTDLMLEICGYKEFMSLDTMLRIYCGTEKETLGDEFFSTATDEELKKHCLEDLTYTEQLYNKFYR